MIASNLLDEAAELLEVCRRAGIRLATAESLTGGLMAGTLTAIPGSSDVVDRGFVTYSNAAKAEMLGVPPELIQQVGAVSEQVARRMAQGALERSRADIAVAVTGIAGPGGSSAAKPLGLVWFGLAQRERDLASEKRIFPGDRTAVRAATVAHALRMIRERL